MTNKGRSKAAQERHDAKVAAYKRRQEMLHPSLRDNPPSQDVPFSIHQIAKAAKKVQG